MLSKKVSVVILAGLLLTGLVAGLLLTGLGFRPFTAAAGRRADSQKAARTYSWTVAMAVSEETLNYKMFEKFKELIEARSNGTIKVNIFPGGQLGNDTEQIQGLINGSNDFCSTITTGVTSFVKEYSVFDLPNAFPNIEVMRTVLDDHSFIDALNLYGEPKNIKLMGFADAGFREMASNIPINSVNDIRGLKMRVIQDPYHIAYWRALGANPLAMDFSEVYIGLQQKIIDAMECPYMLLVANKFYEVQRYIIESDHLPHILVFLMNNNLYNSLPGDIKNLVDQCVNESVVYTRQLADESIAADKKTVENSGTRIISLTPAVKEEIQRRASSVYDLARQNLDNKLIDSLLTAVQNVSP
ncbi:MAG: TRAP transporter substrate-binding protein [Treponema sp.]|jgi:tripartite ATP-independent transporter DctP family solute receptor|nr:TRAP transporter substrate-binding protein [Treponema sp.]